MTLPYSASCAEFSGNGVATLFPFHFKVWSRDELTVRLVDANGVTHPAPGWSAELNEYGGTVSYMHQGAPLPEGYTIRITRNMPFTQGVDLVTGVRFDPQVIEEAMDRATAERQQLLETLSRTVQIPSGAESPEEVLNAIRIAHKESCAASAAAQRSEENAAHSATQAFASKGAASQSAQQAQEWAEVSERAAIGTSVSETPQAGLVPKAGKDGALAYGWVASAVPRGAVLPFYRVTLGGSDGRRPIFWGRNVADERYILCDGGSDDNGGTVPNLLGRMILGTDAALTNLTALGGVYAHTHAVAASVAATTLSVAHMPAHGHEQGNGIGGTSGVERLCAPVGSYGTEIMWTKPTGGNWAHTHGVTVWGGRLPPCRRTAYWRILLRLRNRT